MQIIDGSLLSEQEIKFRQLQASLREHWHTVQDFDRSDGDILVIPSLSLDRRELLKIDGVHHYEERLLFSLIRLQNPRTRLIYVTSQPLHPSVIDYYLQLLPGIPFSHARDRLLLLSTYDSSNKPLTQKILERPRLMARLRQALRPGKSFMICYNSSNWERDLSVEIGVPLYACDPSLQIWGTKSGSRQIFAESGIPYPDGTNESLWNVEELVAAISELWKCKPQLKRLVVKLNEGISGEANALFDLRPIQNISSQEKPEAIKQQLQQMRFQAKSENWENFSGRIPEIGAIVEEFVEGEEKRSPSVQGRITPNGEVEILSTHDQILGGPDGQIYLGCRFPADIAYRMRIQDLGLKVGRVLAEKGALERFGVDFIAVRHPGNEGDYWDIQAIEINLRKGGTTHPFMTLKLLTNGRYDLSTGLFYSQQGREKYYTATDNLQKERYKGLLPNDLMDIIATNRLHFDSGTETGIIFHLMGCLSEFGKLGVTSIGDSPQQAQEIYNRLVKVLDEETRNLSEPDLAFNHNFV
ncbi:peptide ligase PGM1-related protein [Synechocystis sp. PCC 7509]|uniref:peptide ligase PGM1-related protein n=1 Tax=Synechocystis sp. PCC 7509 TaxID=927677 RepID=UPI0002AC39CE|nr:peptide ligase PGM1-related protein [Synechocystis sp. PCC 7509]